MTAERSDLVDSGFVFQQHPQAGSTVDTGSLVKVWVSLGPHPAPPTTNTPNVLGETLERARRILGDAGLRVGHVDSVVRSNGRGEVEHQLPEPGTPTHPGEQVALRIRMAPARIPVPSVIGLRSPIARDSLKRVGLALGKVTPVIGHGSDTSIVSQNPTARSTALPGTFVDVEENQPMVRRRTAVPALLGMTRAEAATRLERDTLFLGSVVIADGGNGPVVVAQRPEAGDFVFLYDSIGVTLQTPVIVPEQPDSPEPQRPFTPATPPPPQRPPADTIVLVKVPEVTDLPADSARKVLDSHGLTAVSTSNVAGTSFVVASQDPDAGTLVPRHAQVQLRLEPVSPIRVIPNLVGLRRAVAAAHASGDGFAMSVQSSRRVLLQLFERVATQEPDTLTISRGDQVIFVDLAIPLIPPLPAGLALAVIAGGVKLWRPRRPPQLPPGVDIQLSLPSPSPPVPSLAPNDRVIRAAVTFTLEAGAGEWRVEPAASSLIAQEEIHV